MITAVLPLPQDEALWESLHLVFATAQGNVRRNRLSDFRNVRASGLIAMKLDEGDRLIGVATCREGDDVLLATRAGRCIRFQVNEDKLRVFAGRDSSGVRGIRLANGRATDEVISLSVLRHIDASPDERAAYLRLASARRRTGEDEGEAETVEAEEGAREMTLAPERAAELEEAEEFLLTVTDGGFGKRSSAYEYRVTGRGGQGIANITLSAAHRDCGRRHLPGAPGRRRDAGDGCGPADPRAGGPLQVTWPRRDGRHAVPPRCRRARDQRVPGGGGRGARRGAPGGAARRARGPDG